MTGTPEPASIQGEDLGLRDTTPRGEIEAVLLALAHAPARQLELGPDDRVGRFSVIRTIGHGGSGVVHEARDLDLGRHVALKVMRTRGDPSSRSAEALESMFKREADAAARLNHPNIVTLFDFGTHEGSPYLILELLHGETLEARIARGPLTVREAVAVMIQIAQGVAYAHRLGVVHRDLKPANVFLTTEGPVKVLDFGLARLQAAVGPADAAAITDSSPTNLTRALIGTPAYMAPEQWRAETADPRTDVYAAGLILYEMLTGRRPWPAADPRVAALASQPVPAVAGVPPPLARLIAQALTKDRAARLASASELLDGLVAVKRTLDSAELVRRNRRIRRVLLAAVPVLVGASWAGSLLVQRAARDAEVDALVAQADGMTARARDGEPDVAALRERAFVLFDARLLDAAEAVWEEARARGAALDHEWAQAGAVLERAFVTGGGRADVRRRLGDVLLARARIAERDHDVEDRDELGERLTTFGDAAALASWRAPAHLELAISPASHVVVERYDDREVVVVGELATTTEVELDLPPGSYRLHLWAAGHPEVMWPVLLGRGESVRGAVSIPARVPEGLVYIPEGRFLYGCADEPIRENFHAQPEHPVTTGAYLIGRHEVTFGEWIRYLEALAPAERARRLPRVATEARGTTAVNSGGDDLALRELGDGHWRLTFRGVEARDDEPWVYADRTGRRTQNWLRFPVMGISFDDGVAYAAWLARTGQVPGARLCDEHEWERAARGADGRTFPNGPRLAPDDANIDVTYGQKDRAFGLDEVGSHPRSDSPFGVADLAGNVWEWTRSVSDFEQPSWERGSSFFQDALTARSYNREYVPRTFRTHLIGLRICASVQAVH